MTLENMKGEDGVFRITDFGCATGINTLLVADSIVGSARKMCTPHSIKEPEFQFAIRVLSIVQLLVIEDCVQNRENGIMYRLANLLKFNSLD